MKISQYKAPFLIYDEGCPLCLRFKQALERTEVANSVQFYSLNDKQLYIEHPYLDESKAKSILHFVDEKLSIFTGKDAISILVKLDSRVEKFSWLIDSKMGQKALDLFYKTSDRYRKSLHKRCKSCDH